MNPLIFLKMCLMRSKKASDVFGANGRELWGFTLKSYDPIALLGTMKNSGVYYAILCLFNPADIYTSPMLQVLTVYENPDGQCEVTGHKYFDLNEMYSAGNKAVNTRRPDTENGWEYYTPSGDQYIYSTMSINNKNGLSPQITGRT